MKDTITKKQAKQYILENISKHQKGKSNLELEFKINGAIATFENMGLFSREESKLLTILNDNSKLQEIRVVKGKFVGEKGFLKSLSFQGSHKRKNARVDLDNSGLVDIGWTCLEFFKNGVWTPDF